MSSQSTLSYLLIEIKLVPKKIPSTPFTERIFLTSSFLILSFLVISNDPQFDTTLPGKNLIELGFGVISV